MKNRIKTIEAINTLIHDMELEGIVVSKDFASVAASLLLGELNTPINSEIKEEAKRILMTYGE